MSSHDRTSDVLDDMSDAEVNILMLRKPTQLKKILESVPKPSRAVPRDGLPMWYRLDLDRKLPVPKIPPGKIVFSRGYIGEDVRRTRDDQRRPSFDLTDPFCRTVSYEYEALHDPHLAHYFAQAPARARMNKLGFSSSEGRALCSLKDFNTYRKSLYNRYMDAVHAEMKRLDIVAREDLTLTRVERDVARRAQVFHRVERARELMDRAAQAQADDEAEKKRLAKEREAKAQARVEYMIQFNEKQRRERAARGREQEQRIKQRVQAAAELELRRKITMIRTWRQNENRRVQRLKREADDKKRKQDDEANRKWQERIDGQNNKIAEEKMLLRLYTEDMSASAARRHRRAEIRAYNRDLELQRIKMNNWKAVHDKGKMKLLKKVAVMFEKTQRGQNAVTREQATEMAAQALAEAESGAGADRLALLGQARTRLEAATTVPPAVMRILEEALDTGIMEFTRRRVGLLLRDVEGAVIVQGARLIDNCTDGSRQSMARRKSRSQRRSIQLTTDLARKYASASHRTSVSFGHISNIASEDEAATDMRSVRDRPPTPVPSATELAEITFHERKEDLLEPIALRSNMPERRKLLDMVNTLAKLLSTSVSAKVQRGIDVDTQMITLPKGHRTCMDWMEAVDAMASAVSEGRVSADCADVRRGADFLTRRVLTRLLDELKQRKAIMEGRFEMPVASTDFYVPEEYTQENTEYSPPRQ